MDAGHPTASIIESDLQWETAIWRLGDLQEWEQNPRVITEAQFNKLVEAIKQDGYHNRIKCTRDGLIVGGHQRKRALLTLGLTEDSYIEVLQSTSDLDPEEYARLNIRDNLHYAEFDFDKLANMYDPVQLIEWHMPENQLPNMSMDFSADSTEGGKEPKASYDGDTEGHLKMIQLFYSADQEEDFRSICDALEKKLGTVNISDTALEAIRFAANHMEAGSLKNEEDLG